MDIVFQEYKKEDEKVLFDLTRKLAEHVKLLDPLGRVKNHPGFAEASFKETLLKVEKHKGKIWFAKDEGNVIGFVIGVIWEQSELNKLEIGVHKLGEVIDIYVDELYRGKGVGTIMLEKMETYFKDEKCDSIWVVVFATNEEAHNMYKKYGFVNREIGMLKNI